MTEQYARQLEIEKLNKEIIDNLINTAKPKNFINFYLSHTQKETMEEFGIRTIKQLTKILKLFNYDFSKPKPSKFKGKPAARSHESYLAGGKKSAETQKQNWEAKSEDEKEAWSIKQSIAHSNSHYSNIKASQNRAYRTSLAPEEKARQDKMRSESMKSWWETLSEEEKESVLQNRFKNGQSYSQKDSGPNLTFKKLLEDNNIIYEREYCLDKKFFDFKVNNILIEIDPTFTHNSTWTPFEYNKPLAKNYHKLKSAIATKYNFRCIHVFDWDDQDKIIRLLKNDRETIYGRDCYIKEISNSDAKTFININHLQNYARSTLELGLFFNDELASVMTFGKPRYNKNYEWELIRYCSSKNIIGGVEKLFNYFLKNYNPTSIISYCDLSKFNGTTYEKLNFRLKAIPAPSKHWYNTKTHEHYTDALLRKQGFSRLIHRCDAKDDIDLPTNNNRDLMIDAGFVEIFDCGQATYVWTKN